MVLQTPAAMLHSTESYWQAWLKTGQNQLEDYVSKELKRLYDTSLFVLRSHADNRGSIIASSDSEMIEYGKDDYSYMWPRDAAFIAIALDSAGFDEITKSFFEFCKDVLHPDGYLHHRFRSDQSLGSTWHATTAQHDWLKDGILQLPIQEDETASVIFALWNHYQVTKDLEFIEMLYKPLIEKAADFLIKFRHKPTGLPLPSYDLWEEKIGVSTYTCAAVYGGLMAAARFSELLDKRNHMRRYKDAAAEIKAAAIEHLFSEQLGSLFAVQPLVRMERSSGRGGRCQFAFGLWYFGMLEQTHPLFERTAIQVEQRLRNPYPTGGYIRYEQDGYFKDTELSNPWFIATLWEAQRLLRKNEVTEADFTEVEHAFDWVLRHLYLSGVMSEQLNPYTGDARSATPLVWSHSVFVETLGLYIKKKKEAAAGGGADLPVHEL